MGHRNRKVYEGGASDENSEEEGEERGHGKGEKRRTIARRGMVATRRIKSLEEENAREAPALEQVQDV